MTDADRCVSVHKQERVEGDDEFLGDANQLYIICIITQ